MPSIQRLVNRAFAPLMSGEGGQTETLESPQAGYVPLSPHRDEVEGQPSIVVLPVPSPPSRLLKLSGMPSPARLPAPADAEQLRSPG